MGSSASTNTSTIGVRQSTVAGLSYARLLTKLQQKETEIQTLRADNKALQSEIANYKKLLRKSGGVNVLVPDDDDMKSVSSFGDFVDICDSVRSSFCHPASEDKVDDFVTLPKETQLNENLPKIGDHVVSMWGASKWQYFTATICAFDAKELKYTIDWDDGDPTGRVIDYFNLASDKVPEDYQIGVGSKVLFHQGSYRQQEVHGVNRSGGLRWHQGEITKITKTGDGTKRYQGKHTKSGEDGKWISYKDYSQFFADYKLEDFRMPPNVFDILDSVTPERESASKRNTAPTEDEEEIDVFISYAVVNSTSAVINHEIKRADLPPSYEQVMIENLCDPRDIVKYLKEMGIKVFFTEKQDDSSLLEIASTLRRSKVFIACLSDEYASNDRCRMEFQHAKKTLKLPVIPLVVGTGSFEWKMTVVGLLIAGELYIHFKDRTVQGFKMNELLRSIKRHIPELQLKNVQFAATGDASLDLITTPGLTLTGAKLETGKTDIFFSYCWSNSYTAKQDNQISSVVGNEWNDPRIIGEKLSKATGAVTWIDIKRLESAADGMGMFEQIATAIKDCQVVVACVSNEYAESDNCRMELQFAASSLQKPFIIVPVGEGEQWVDTVVGKVAMLGKATIVMQNISNDQQLDEKIEEIKNQILKIDSFDLARKDEEVRPKKEGKAVNFFKKSKKKSKLVTRKRSTLESEPSKIFKAPTPGAHVVCLHQNWAYFMATVVEFDQTDLIYTVDWDDGDPSGRVQSYKDVALDVTPDSAQIGVDSTVIFAQGAYGGTEGNNTGGLRYHQGKITAINTDENGVKTYDGEHTQGEAEGKWINWTGYNPQFRGLKLEALRVSPNAMDALYACKQAFNLSNENDDEDY